MTQLHDSQVMTWEFASSLVGDPTSPRGGGGTFDYNTVLSRAEENGWELVSAVPVRWSPQDNCMFVDYYRLFFKRQASGQRRSVGGKIDHQQL